ncbi:MAG TPA: TasA family protein [Acidimicrobiia bacterium]|nr:TasA family protein [Acidimicrobiia bacterium]
MKRRILLSVVTSAAAIAAVVTGGAFAPFSDTGTAVGGVQAGTLEVSVDGDGDGGSLVFDSEDWCDANMAPGDVCEADVTVVNTGSLSATYVASIADDESACFTPGITPAFEAALEPGHAELPDDPTEDHDAGDSHTGTVTITLDSTAGNECQGASTTVTFTVDATQSATPHD